MAAQVEMPEWLSSRLDRPAAVFGAGVSGLAARDLLESLGGQTRLYDERIGAEGLRAFGAEQASEVGLAVYSPGFPFEHPWLASALAAGVETVPEMDLGASLWKGPIVAITGTNGKTTLTEFLEKALRGVGIEAYAAGNIGRPLSRLVADKADHEAFAVCEVSSFQAARSTRFHADYVLWTNFDEDHLDRHGSMLGYFQAKRQLVALMRGDAFFYDDSVLSHGRGFGFELDPAGLIRDEIDPLALGLKSTVFEGLPERLNYLMARALWLRLGLEESLLVEAAHGFQKSPHRMELVCRAGGISYWDDSKATNFHAVYGALARFADPVVWIGGGKNKGGDVAGFARRLAPRIRSAHLIGQTKEELAGALRDLGAEVHVYPCLEDSVAGARSLAAPGDNILLSPGFASLDMFESYSQRGEVFKKAINSLEQI